MFDVYKPGVSSPGPWGARVQPGFLSYQAEKDFTKKSGIPGESLSTWWDRKPSWIMALGDLELDTLERIQYSSR